MAETRSALDPQFNQHHDAESIAKLQNLEQLHSIAAAAGHSTALIGKEYNAGWVDIEIAEDNVRPTYDRRFITTFSPDLIKAMLFELSELRKQTANA